MSSTANLGLPLLQPSQSQKHVTVNEAIARLDGLCQTNLVSITTTTPPLSAAEGATFGVPEGAVGAWDGRDGDVAIFSNGGWVFLTPGGGWRAYIADAEAYALHDGTEWRLNAVSVSAGGAASLIEVMEFDHVIGAGPSSDTISVIPSHSVLLGVTARVIGDISGTLSSWHLGVSGGDNRYGSGLGLGAGSFVMGLSGQPLAYYADTPLLLSAEGGDFAGGEVRFALHLYRMTLPRA
ncbi:MAG: DUF2793 domain-containing protein [Pseudomonadota bacterium]